MSEMAQFIKKLAADQYESGKPAAVMVGTVLSNPPLKIQVDQKLTLTEPFLILTKSVVDYSVNMTVDHTTEPITHSHSYTDDGYSKTTGTYTHSHKYTGTKKFTVHNGLKAGDKVILLRVQGGKKYVVLDVIGGGTV